MNDRPTYPQLLKLFYKHSFPDQLGAPASAVAQAIIYKSNELWFPAEFTMSNKELSQLSGEKLSNIGRTRQKVLDTCIVDGQPLFIYVNGAQRRAGVYKINFNSASTQLQDNFNSTSNSRQKQPEIDNDHNSTLPNKTKHINNKPVASLPEKKSKRVGLRERIIRQANRDEELPNGMKRGELLDMLEFKPAVINYGKSDHMGILDYLGSQPKEHIEWAVEQTKAANDGKGIGANGALKWIYNGVDQYEYRVNGGNGGGSIGDIRRAREAKNLALMKEELADLESREGDWSDHIMAMRIAIAEAEVG